MRLLESLRQAVTRYPGRIAAAWLTTALAVGLAAPSLTDLAARCTTELVPDDAESARASTLIRAAWPDQASASLIAIALHRPGGLSGADRAFARRLADRCAKSDRPEALLRAIGPDAPAEIADRLRSRDGTTELVLAHLSTTFVSPSGDAAIGWIQARAAELSPPDGLGVACTGGAALGRDHMRAIHASLDRSAVVTVVLLLVVLLLVYRSPWLAAVPMVTIGLSLVISRGLLAWLARSGWEVSPLVELFLVVILFGSGTDFCLLISWRFGEHWDAGDPAGAMRQALRKTTEPLLTSAGTVIAGLALMGVTRFKLFSSTGPCVALGLALTLFATMTLTPALLVLLAKHRPRAFAALNRGPSGFWGKVARLGLKRPALVLGATLALLIGPAIVGLRAGFVHDMLAELPAKTPSVAGLRLIAAKFGAGAVAPVSIVLRSGGDFRGSEGLALIDDVSRWLARDRRVAEVRSATQPLGSTGPLEPARIAAQLGEVRDGFDRMAAGADELRDGLDQGAAKLRMALLFDRLASKPREGDDPRRAMLDELARAADGARALGDGARLAQGRVATILDDPVGRRTLDRLLLTEGDVRDHPELQRAFEAYIAPDGHSARIDLASTDLLFSRSALEGVESIRRRLADDLARADGFQAEALVTGTDAEWADIRALTRADQVRLWVLVPLGVFLILICALRDPLSCLNLVVSMLLTYAFALGITHLVFVNGLCAGGIDWKVPYFLFVLLVAVGVDYNVFLMTRVREEARASGLRVGIRRAVAQTGGLISSAAAITACSFASFLASPLGSIRQLGFALVVGIAIDALLVRPLLVPCGHWLLNRHRVRTRAARTPKPSRSRPRALPEPSVEPAGISE